MQSVTGQIPCKRLICQPKLAHDRTLCPFIPGSILWGDFFFPLLFPRPQTLSPGITVLLFFTSFSLFCTSFFLSFFLSSSNFFLPFSSASLPFFFLLFHSIPFFLLLVSFFASPFCCFSFSFLPFFILPISSSFYTPFIFSLFLFLFFLSHP